MNNDYKESKKALDKIRSEYGCKGEIIFKSAIQYVIESGTDRLNDDGLVFEWLTQIDDKHNNAEADGKHLFISRDFEKAIVKCAAEISKINPINIILYLQKEWLFGDYRDITYNRAIQLLKYGVSHVLQDGLTDDAREDLDCFGIDDDELEFLGFGYVLNEEEEE